VEVERKFLVPALPDLSGFESSEIEQGYLALPDEKGGAEVRLRSRGNELTLTVKSAGGEVRDEEELELDRDEFDRLWKLTEGRRLAKRRYVIPHDGLELELDVYAGALEGLLVAEVEFEDEDAAGEFEPPAWFGDEVTGKEHYKNESLATRGLPDDHVQGEKEGDRP
jgi:CYTH domain-containing protein